MIFSHIILHIFFQQIKSPKIMFFISQEFRKYNLLKVASWYECIKTGVETSECLHTTTKYFYSINLVA